MTRQRATLIGLTALLAGSVLYFQRAIFGPGVFLARDVQRVYYPLRDFWASQVSRGEFPGWFPYDALGQPLAGSVISGVFHPSNLLYLLFELTTALQLNTLLCFPIALGGAYLFFRAQDAGRGGAAVGAVVFGFSGYLVSMTNNLLYLMAAATLPWVLLAFTRLLRSPSLKALGAVAALLALVLLAGDPQTYAVTAGVLLLMALVPGAASGSKGRALAWGGGAVALSALVAAVQLTCALQIVEEGTVSARSLDTAQLWSVHPLRLLDLMLGNVFLAGVRDQGTVTLQILSTGAYGFWADSLYVGLPALFLAGIGLWAYRRQPMAWIAAGFVLVFLLLAFGKHFPLYGWAFKLLPPWRPFRYPEKLFPHLLIWLGLLIARGTDWLSDAPAPIRRRAGWVIGAIGLACVGLFAAASAGSVIKALEPFSAAAPSAWVGISAELNRRFAGAALQSAAVCVCLGGVLVMVQRTRWIAWITLSLVGLNLWWVCEPVYLVADPQLLKLTPGFLQAIKDREGVEPEGVVRVYSGSGNLTQFTPTGATEVEAIIAEVSNVLLPETTALHHLESANSYLPGISRRVATLIDDGPRWWARYLGMANVGYVTVSASEYRRTGRMVRVISENLAFDLYLLENPTRLPRAHLARARCVKGPEESLALIKQPTFRPGVEAAVECSAPLPQSTVSGSLGEVRITRYRPGRVELLATAEDAAVLVIADAYFRGWTAKVDGAPAPVLPTNHAFQGVPLTAGEHQVLLEYRTPLLPLGGTLSVLGVSLCGVPWLVHLRARRRRRASAPS